MAEQKKENRPTPRQLIGISMPPDVAVEFKAEAARRSLSLRNLFQEMWADYKAKPTDKNKS